ncbi:MAG: hypothetical protein QW290_02310 [Sulfolobales archaeon]
METIKIPLILTLYGVLLLALLPLLIRATTMLGLFMERYLTSLGSSILSLAIIGLATVIALYTWLKTARWLTNKKCEIDANEGSY